MYHIVDGEVRKCTAHKVPCPINGQHFTTKDEAQVYANEINQSEYGVINVKSYNKEENLLDVYKNNKEIIIISSEDGELHSIKYANLNVDWSDPMVRDARGLILDNDGNIIARPFTKFFNMNELSNRNFEGKYDDIIHLSEPKDLPYELTEKRDGSLAIGFNHKGKFRMASSGSLDSRHVEMFNDYIEKNFSDEDKAFLNNLSKTHTIMFEYTGSDNMIVVHYEDTEMTIIGVNNTKTNEDLSVKEMRELFKDTNIPVVKEINMSIEEASSYFNNKQNVEGFVVRYSDGFRLKVKTDEYFKLHKTYTALDFSDNPSSKNPKTVMEFLATGREGDLDDLLSSVNSFANKTKLDEIEKIRKNSIKRIKAFDTFASNPSQVLNAIDKRNLYKLGKNDTVFTYDDGTELSRDFIENFNKSYSAFKSKSEEANTLISSAKRNRRAEVREALKPVYGEAINYTQGISEKSFAYKLFDTTDYLINTNDEDKTKL